MVDFGFAFNASNFSDRVLCVEILSSEESDCEGHGRKRKRGDEATHCDDSGCDDLDCSSVVKVETLHVSSAILAVKSPFFYKLFNNGMRESHQKHLTLRINACEEEPLMDLLKFLYTNTLSATTALDLLDVLMVADKFEVVSCMRYCSLLLKELPMSLDSAHFYLELPSSVLMTEAIQPLTDAAKQYLAPIYKLQDEAMVLPLPAVERVLHSDDVQVVSEDEVFDFMLKWARAHYPKLEEYREILNKRFVPMLRFPHMTYWKLMEVLVCPDLDHEQVSKLVREALFVRAGLPTITSRRLTERIYKYLPIKVVQLQFPDWPRCVVYFDLKKEECANVSRPHRLYSQPFHLGGKGFALIAKCKKDRHFGLYLYMGRGKNTSILDYEFEVKRKPSEEFQSKYKVDSITLTRGVMDGKENLFGIPWTEFMSDGNDYFIDGILHIRAELTLKN